jgi:hypothetical protein
MNSLGMSRMNRDNLVMVSNPNTMAIAGGVGAASVALGINHIMNMFLNTSRITLKDAFIAMHLFVDYYYLLNVNALSEEEDVDLVTFITASYPEDDKNIHDAAYWNDWIKIYNLNDDENAYKNGIDSLITPLTAFQLMRQFINNYYIKYFDGLQNIVELLNHISIIDFENDVNAKAWSTIAEAVINGAVDLSEVKFL